MRPYIPIFQDKKAGEWSASQLCLADRSGYHWRNGRNYHRKRRAWERRRERRGQASRVHENHKLCPLRKWGAIRGCLLLNTWGQINIIYTYIWVPYHWLWLASVCHLTWVKLFGPSHLPKRWLWLETCVYAEATIIPCNPKAFWKSFFAAISAAWATLYRSEKSSGVIYIIYIYNIIYI